MDTPSNILLAWCVPEPVLSWNDARNTFEPLGYAGEKWMVSEELPTEAELLVLHTGSFRDLEHLRYIHNQAAKPCLIIVADADEETKILAWPELRPSTDLCREEDVVRQLGHRLRRLVTTVRPEAIFAVDANSEAALQKQVYGREYLNVRLAREFSNARKHCRSLTVAWIALDHLDAIHMAEGRSAREYVLATLGRLILSNIRVIDWVAQFSQNEFCLVMPDTWLDEGQFVMDRITNELATASIQINGRQLALPRVSIGLAELTDREGGYEDLMQKAAEEALIEKIGDFGSENTPLH